MKASKIFNALRFHELYQYLLVSYQDLKIFAFYLALYFRIHILY